MKTPRLIVCLTFVLALTGKSAASTIIWGDSLGGLDLTSTGGVLDESYTFALGTFGASFTPTAANVGEWMDYWKLLDKASYNPALKWFSGQVTLSSHSGGAGTYFTSDYGYAADPDYQAPNPPANFTFEPQEQVYIWVYNSEDPVPGTEWGLFTRTSPVSPVNPGAAGDFSWRLPSGPGDQTNFPSEFYMPAVDMNPFGAANGERGPGEYASLTASSYQTATFAPVPEPTAAALLAGAIFFLRRRR